MWVNGEKTRNDVESLDITRDGLIKSQGKGFEHKITGMTMIDDG